MEVMMATDFNFDSTCSSPFVSTPSSPARFGGGVYFSAPTSPNRASAFYHSFNNLSFIDRISNRVASVAFDWEEKPGAPKSPKSPRSPNSKDDKDDNENKHEDDEEEDFAFDFSGQYERSSVSADELFDGGKIKPLKPPPRLQIDDSQNHTSTLASSPRSPIEKFRRAFSPKQRKENRQIDPFVEETRRQERGRERVVSQSAKSTHRSTRSLSPFRPPYVEQEHSAKPVCLNSKPGSGSGSGSSSKSSSKRWRLRDFLLFRSASEGRASDRDPLSKYSPIVTSKRITEDVKNSSFRSTDSSGSGSSKTGSMRRGPLSAHELHYTTNRAVSAELKKKTYLPYKQGLFGWMARG